MKAIILMKKGRQYKTIVKEFNNEAHLDNYILLMEQKGTKIIYVWYKGMFDSFPYPSAIMQKQNQ